MAISKYQNSCRIIKNNAETMLNPTTNVGYYFEIAAKLWLTKIVYDMGS